MWRVVWLALLIVAACGHGAMIGPVEPVDASGFYAKRLKVLNIPLIASNKVGDESLERAGQMISEMLAHRPEFANILADEGYRVAILAESEAITDLPENSHWKLPERDDPRLTRCERKHYDTRIGAFTARQYWNARTRGIGGKLTVSAEEDVLGKRSSRYYGETILVHEFAHNILDAIRLSDPKLYVEVETAYANALEEGLWKDEYASTTIQEYWAEGTQFWFNSNRLAVFGGRQILNHTDLIAYDPGLAAALRQVYGDRHQITGDPFYLHPARVPPGPIPENTAEVC